MSETRNNPPGPFAPYVSAVTENDPLMKRVPFKQTDIGANAASMPGNLMRGNGGPGNIEHVGSTVRKGR